MMKRIALFSAFALLGLSCQDGEQIPTDPQAPSFVISDGSRGGNPDFFWLPPLVGNPHPIKNADWDDGEFNDKLAAEVHICLAADLLAPGTAGCDAQQPEGYPIVFTRDSGPPLDTDRVLVEDGRFGTRRYGLRWRTIHYNLDPESIYRIVVIVGTAELGYADIEIAEDEGQYRNVNTNEFIPLKDGQWLIYIRFRIENGALCDPDAPDCASETVTLSEGGTVALSNGDNVNIPPQEGSTVVTTVTVTPCTDANGDPINIPVDLPIFGECLNVTADPPLEELLAEPAVISICSLDPLVDLPDLPPGQSDLITLHRFDDPDLFALPHAADNCEELLASTLQEQGMLMRFAKAGAGVVRDILGFPRPLQARRVVRRLDIGRGGASPFFSLFQYALPAKMLMVLGTNNQEAEVETNVPIPPAVLVKDLLGNPVEGATVTFEVTVGGGAVGSTTLVVQSDGDGIASTNFWTLGPDAGFNYLKASGRGIAVRNDDGPREGFDPFIPLLGPNFNEDEGAPVPVNTPYFKFRAKGIVPQ